MIYHSTAVATLVLASLSAQSVGVTLEALTPATIQASNATSSNSNTWPVGPMGSYGSFSATLPSGAGGNVNWSSSAHSVAASVTLEHSLSNITQQPSFLCQMGPHEFLVKFTSATPRSGALHMTRFISATAGAPAPTVQVDLNNNGTIEINNLQTPQSQPLAVSFGPQPLLVRLVIDASLGAQAGLHNYLAVTLVPDNDLSISTPVIGCAQFSPPPPPFLQPSFDDRGIELLSGYSGGNPSVLVLGWSPQPALLSIFGTTPCLLLPSPDVVIATPSSAFHIPLPASIRPATFFAQGVALAPSGLISSDGYSVTAH